MAFLDTLLKTKSYKGFDLISATDIPDCASKSLYLRHRNTGLEVFHLLNDDEENLFSFAFRTPSADSTGAAHILEHSVFCGSEKFPLREPFVNIMNQSVNTFLNAMTYPDKTVYPASSMNKADYFNLMNVYADAVFFPLLRKEAFMQEAHRLEIDKTGKYSIQGVVYNEMKGAYSSFDSVAADIQLRALFNGTVYEKDSGGDPLLIPTFTYEKFRAFHDKYYSPSNCLLFLYGNISTAEQLDFIQEKVLDRLEKKYAVPLKSEKGSVFDFMQSEKTITLEKPGELRAPAPVTGSDGETVTENWLVCHTDNLDEIMECLFLEQVLLGNDSSPVAKALIDSGLGTDLAPVSGLCSEMRDSILAFGLRGVKKGNEKKVQKTVFDVLGTLCKKGIAKKDIAAAVLSVDFANREVVRSHGPYSLILMDRALNGWNYGTPPDNMLCYRAAFEKVRKALCDDSEYTEKLIQKYLLSNNQRILVTAYPEKKYLSDRDKKEQLLVKALVKKADSVQIIRETDALHEYQQHKETAEEVSCIPHLNPSELSSSVDWIDTELTSCPSSKSGEIPLYINREKTNGIVYFDVCFPVDTLEPSDYPYLPLFASCAGNVGWNGKNWAQCLAEAAVTLGGLGSRLFTTTCRENAPESPATGREWMFLSMKFPVENREKAFSLFSESIKNMEFTDAKRIENLTAEFRNGIRSSVIPAGNRFALSRARCALNRAYAIAEIWDGLSQLFTAEKLIKENPVDLGLKFTAIARKIFDSGAVLHLTADNESLEKVLPFLSSFSVNTGLTQLKPKRNSVAEDFYKLCLLPGEKTNMLSESLVTQSQVGFAATVMGASPYGTKEAAAEQVLSHWMGSNILWEKIRTTGGAYGAYASSDAISRIFQISTFRDPTPEKSVKTFTDCLTSCANMKLSSDDAERAVTGTYGDDVQPLSPVGRGSVGFLRMLYGVTEQARKEKIEQLLAVKPEDIQCAAERIAKNIEYGRIALICNKSVKNYGVICNLPL